MEQSFILLWVTYGGGVKTKVYTANQTEQLRKDIAEIHSGYGLLYMKIFQENTEAILNQFVKVAPKPVA